VADHETDGEGDCHQKNQKKEKAPTGAELNVVEENLVNQRG
jgi:hypothetical protein